MNADQSLREQLVNLLTLRQAHMSFSDAVKDFPLSHINSIIPETSYTFWHLLEHIRYCQWDILDYIVNPDYQHVEWPKDYWPAPGSNTDAAGWQKTIDDFHSDLQSLVDLVKDPNTDLHAQIPHGAPGHNILREILIVAQHNSYHLGEFGILRQTMKLW